ncbi:histidine kinase [Marivirga sp. S37H4]|uniref:Histidine kinase n=1 Tax=Marivirga aurantiaca TaxID=2802615 RepID=A0A935C8V6_9BACT|nr:histidine kinase [Marivirga aurantiaca]MBK6265659.1 histidine kinase [Marivirga aurantiaca]
MRLHPFLYLLFNKILPHSLFWLGVFVFYSYFFEESKGIIPNPHSFSAFLMPVTIGTTYTVNYFLIPKYLLKKKYTMFSLYSIYTLILSAFAIVISIFYGLIFMNALQYDQMVPLSKSLIFTMVAVYLVVLLISAFKLLKHNYSSAAKNKELENKILLAQLKLKEQELQYLKMQIHPHFLFNTLNTLYGYALKKSEETPEMILKLSNLLDYLLYQVDKPMVSLTNEIAHIKDYIDLEKMRFHDSLYVELDIPDMEPCIYIAPMLLIPFVENSFKHGNRAGNKLRIYISLKTETDQIHFKVKNSYNSKDSITEKGGIGLANLQKRLDLLYPDNYTFGVNKDEEWFEINLILNHQKLKSNG